MHSCRLEHKDDYYETLVKWWGGWNFPVLAKSSIPDRIFVVSSDGVDLYAMPVYFGDSDLCWIGFVTSNIEAPKELRSGAMNILNKYTEMYMKSIGARLIMTVSGTPVLMKLFSDEHYIVSGVNYNEYIKLL